MAIKTFTAGSILTASDTNTFLANSGLVYITGGPLGQTSTNFVGCFTSAYRDYRIEVSNGIMSAGTDFCFRMLVGSTPHGANYYFAYTGLTGAGAAANQSNINQTICRTGASTSAANDTFCLSMDIFQPQVASVYTFTLSQSTNAHTDVFTVRNGGAGVATTTQFDGINFLSAGGQTIGGNVRIYGYRQA